MSENRVVFTGNMTGMGKGILTHASGGIKWVPTPEPSYMHYIAYKLRITR
jgi:hypothetical protein